MQDDHQYEFNIFGEDLSNEQADHQGEEIQYDDLEIFQINQKAPQAKKKRTNRYVQIIEYIFQAKYKDGDRKIKFERDELNEAADTLKIKRVDNLGDLNYFFFVTEMTFQRAYALERLKDWPGLFARQAKESIALNLLRKI